MDEGFGVNYSKDQWLLDLKAEEESRPKRYRGSDYKRRSPYESCEHKADSVAPQSETEKLTDQVIERILFNTKNMDPKGGWHKELEALWSLLN